MSTFSKKNQMPIMGLLLVVVILVGSLLTFNMIQEQQNYSGEAARKPSNPTPITQGTVLYFSPSKGPIASGSNFVVDVKVNATNGQMVNAVQANIAYPTDKLQVVSVDTSASAFQIEATNTVGAGMIMLARGSITPLTGDLVIARVTFQSTVSRGNAVASFTSGSAVVSSDTNVNVLTNSESGVYSLKRR